MIQNVTVHFTNMARQTWPWWALFCRIFLCFWEEILWCGLETHYSRRLRCMVSQDIAFGYSHVQTLQNDIKWPFMVTLVTWASLALAKFRLHINTEKIVGLRIIGSMYSWTLTGVMIFLQSKLNIPWSLAKWLVNAGRETLLTKNLLKFLVLLVLVN